MDSRERIKVIVEEIRNERDKEILEWVKEKRKKNNGDWGKHSVYDVELCGIFNGVDETLNEMEEFILNGKDDKK